MKNVLSIKFGKEQIALWQIFIMLFIVFMFTVCLFLGVGFITSAKKEAKIIKEELDVTELSIITDFKSVPDSLYDSTYKNDLTFKDKYNNNYKKYISDNDGILLLDDVEYNYYLNIGSTIYKVDFNKNNWFLINELNKYIDNSNIIYVVDTEMNFHRLNIDVDTVVKNPTLNEGYKEYDIGTFTFFYNQELDYFYGYSLIEGDSINDYYITINGEGYGLSEGAYMRFFDKVNSNISIKKTDTYGYVGINLTNEYKNYKLTDNFSLDLYSNVLIHTISNGTRGNRNSIMFTYKNGTNEFVKLREVFKDIDEAVINTAKTGYLPYTFNDKTIYLRYNLVDYPECNYTLGSFNGVVIGDHKKSVVIQFSKTYEFNSQDELEERLTSLLNEFLK